MMLRHLSLLLILFAVPLMTTHAQAPDFVMLTFEVSGGDATVTLNGFPVLQGAGSGGAPVNLHLTPGTNHLEVQFAPENGAGDASLHLALNVAGGGGVSGSDDAGGLAEVTLTEATEGHTQTFEVPASWADKFTAGTLYTELPVLDDADALKTTALHLVKLLRDGAYDEAAALSRPRLAAFIASMSQPGMPDNVDDFVPLLAQQLDLFMQGGDLPAMDASDIVLVPWADGRIWEVQNTNGEALLTMHSSDGSQSLPLYLAEVDGAIQVIR